MVGQRCIDVGITRLSNDLDIGWQANVDPTIAMTGQPMRGIWLASQRCPDVGRNRLADALDLGWQTNVGPTLAMTG